MKRYLLAITTCLLSTILLFILLISPMSNIYGEDTVVATLVNTIDTSSWSPPSPDPAGITYNPLTNTLFVADSEVDEMTIFQGKNVYETTLTGTLISTASTMAFTPEPTDIAFNQTNGHYFFSNDGRKRVYEVDLGADNLIGTNDDIVTFISASAFGSVDTEGVEYGDNKLFIADGTNQVIYVVDPGINGRFDGIAPTGDDQVTSFNVGVFGVEDPEGVAYNPDSGTLFVVDYKRINKIAIEVTTTGQLVRKIDISQANTLHPGGVIYAPASNNSGQKNLYIVDRGLDNDSNPTENDGKIYEMSLPSTVPTDTPTPTPTLDPNEPTITPTATPTTTPTPGAVLMFTPTADVSLLENQFTKNFGLKPSLELDNSPRKHILLKFTVNGVNTLPVQKAILKLYVVNSAPFGGNFYKVTDNTWAENTVTWDNAPTADPNVIGSLGNVTAGNWYEIDLSTYITGDGIYSLKITSTSADGAAYSSKEGNSSFIPYLEITK